jgi:hypothetical protein
MKKGLMWVNALGLLLCGARASAQELSSLIPDLILRGITLPGAADPGSPHAGHFTLGNPTFGGSQGASQVDNPSVALVTSFNDRFRSQLPNFPLGSSTGGLTYTFDESRGTYSRSSTSFGPAFAERAATIGRKKLSVGASYQHTSFDTFGGKNLDDGSISFYLPHTDCCNMAAPPPSLDAPGFEGDILQASLHLKASTDTFALSANYGLTNNLDVGIAVPILQVKLDALVHATIIRLSSAASPFVHTFVTGSDVTQKDFSSSGSASGVGDAVIRSKYNFFRQGNTGVAVGLDLRLPTGDAENLLGTGATQAKIYGILSAGSERVATHFNFGYTASGTGPRDLQYGSEPIGASDEVNYAGGVEFVATPRLTVIGDLLGRNLRGAGQIVDQTRTFNYRVGATATLADPLLVSSTNPLTGQPYTQLGLVAGNLNLAWGTVGAKYNPTDRLLIAAHALFPVTSNGLRDKVTFALGFEYAF